MWFFIEKTKGSRGREWTNERKAHHALGGEEVGGPPSPPPLIDHEALRGLGYISQGRPQDVTPSFELVLC